MPFAMYQTRGWDGVLTAKIHGVPLIVVGVLLSIMAVLGVCYGVRAGYQLLEAERVIAGGEERNLCPSSNPGAEHLPSVRWLDGSRFASDGMEHGLTGEVKWTESSKVLKAPFSPLSLTNAAVPGFRLVLSSLSFLPAFSFRVPLLRKLIRASLVWLCGCSTLPPITASPYRLCWLLMQRRVHQEHRSACPPSRGPLRCHIGHSMLPDPRQVGSAPMRM